MPKSNLTHPPLAIAHRLRAYGFSLLPVDRTSKRPAVPWKEFQQRHPTDEELRAWFTMPGSNVGIVTGAVSGVVVVDLDDAAARTWAQHHLPSTPMRTRTPRGGEHWLYQHPGGHVANRVRVQPAGCPYALALDIRGDGGYVVAPGSSQATTGRRYVAPAPWPETLDVVPVFDITWVHEARAVKTEPRVPIVSAVPILNRARQYLEKIPRPEIGAGSDAATLYAAARLVRGFALSAADTEDLLWDWAGGRTGWSRDWVAEKVRHAERYGTEPMGGLLR